MYKIKASLVPAEKTDDSVKLTQSTVFVVGKSGYSLKNAIDSQQIKEWREILLLLCEVSSIIATAHGLPERVLHRDIRPPNIMLRGYDYNTDDWSVCVLDFDLAFHKGANEVSIQPSSDTNGFLAPEQIERQSKFTTRSALVDSYGMGMLIYYVIARRTPKPEQSLHADWHNTLKREIIAKKCEEWQSLPFRIARIIERCTRYNQSQRLDMTQIHGALFKLRRALLSNKSVNDGELLAEELAPRIAYKLGIIDALVWDEDRLQAHIQRYSGENLSVRVNSEDITVLACWHNDGTAKYDNVRHSMNDSTTAAKSKFSKNGFNDIKTSIEATGAMIDLTLTNTQVRLKMNLLADLISSINLAPKSY